MTDSQKTEGQQHPDETTLAGESAQTERSHNRTLRPESTGFEKFMLTGWGEENSDIRPLDSSRYTPARLRALGRKFAGERLIIPAGQPKVRNDDCDYAFRPDSAFAYYTGLGQDYEAGAILVLEPVPSVQNGKDAGTEETHNATLYAHPRSDQTTSDYYRSAAYGEYWVGARPGLKGLETMTGIHTADIADFDDAVSRNVSAGDGGTHVRIIRNADPALTGQPYAFRTAAGAWQQPRRTDT